MYFYQVYIKSIQMTIKICWLHIYMFEQSIINDIFYQNDKIVKCYQNNVNVN